MNRTTIDWPGLTHTWNPIVGCTKGCSYCYARKLHDKRHKAYMEGKRLPIQYAYPFSQLQFCYSRLNDPIREKKPAVIFVGSMCDIFDPNVPRNWVEMIIEVMRRCQQHTFMMLTKRPERYPVFKWPENCMLGITMEHAGKAGRILDLYGIDNRKFVSIEPIQGPVSTVVLSAFELVIVGADSNPGAPAPERGWIDSIKHPNIHYKANILKHFPDLKTN